MPGCGRGNWKNIFRDKEDVQYWVIQVLVMHPLKVEVRLLQKYFHSILIAVWYEIYHIAPPTEAIAKLFSLNLDNQMYNIMWAVSKWCTLLEVWLRLLQNYFHSIQFKFARPNMVTALNRKYLQNDFEMIIHISNIDNFEHLQTGNWHIYDYIHLLERINIVIAFKDSSPLILILSSSVLWSRSPNVSKIKDKKYFLCLFKYFAKCQGQLDKMHLH